MEELASHLKRDMEIRIKLAGGNPDSNGNSQQIDPGDGDYDDIVGAGLGVKVDKD